MTRAEKTVAEFLRENEVWWMFEQPVYVKDPQGRPRVWSPDFYLPDLGMHVEVCGAERTSYKFREKVYKENKIPVIFVQTYKRTKWKLFLIARIKEIHEKRSTFLSGL